MKHHLIRSIGIIRARLAAGSVKLLLLLSLFMTGCATDFPLISHVHVGHSLTGWTETPDNEGLFVVSEQFASRVVQMSARARQNAEAGRADELAGNMQLLLSLLGSSDETSDSKYSFLRAFNEARQHIEYAIQSDDVSENLKLAGGTFLLNSEAVLARAEVIKAIAETPLSASEAVEVVNELHTLARQNFEGEDLDGNGHIGNTAEEYGLRQLRADLAAALRQESEPAYLPVEQKYLFGLVRLPDGTWKFRSVGGGGYDGDGEGGYGGGDGGGSGGGSGGGNW